MDVMKKFLFSTLIMMVSVFAQAQIVSSSSSRVVRIVNEKPTEPFLPSYYVKGGLSVLSFNNNDEGWETPSCYSITGYNLVFGYEKPLFQDTKDVPVRGGIFWGVEAGLSSRGSGVEFGGNWCTIFKHRLIVNPKLTFKMGSPKFSWYYDAGAFLGFDYASSIDAGSSTIQKILDEQTESVVEDYGLSVGTGFWINRFEIGVSVLFGFSPLIDSGTATGSDYVLLGNSLMFHWLGL